MGYASMSKPPCKGCEDRHERCHVNCAEYNEWHKAHKSAEKKAREGFLRDKIINGYQIAEIEKNKRKRR